MIVHILPTAGAELEAIGDYIARNNPPRAVSFVRELREKCLCRAQIRLSLFPLFRATKRVYGTAFTVDTKFSIVSWASPSALRLSTSYMARAITQRFFFIVLPLLKEKNFEDGAFYSSIG